MLVLRITPPEASHKLQVLRFRTGDAWAIEIRFLRLRVYLYNLTASEKIVEAMNAGFKTVHF